MSSDEERVEQRCAGARWDNLVARLTEAERRLLEAQDSIARDNLDGTSAVALASYLGRALHAIQEAKVLTKASG